MSGMINHACFELLTLSVRPTYHYAAESATLASSTSWAVLARWVTAEDPDADLFRLTSLN